MPQGWTFRIYRIGGWLYNTPSEHRDEDQISAASRSTVIQPVTCHLANVIFNYFEYIHSIQGIMGSTVGRRPVDKTFRDSSRAPPDKC
jgi:hypothetical protein